jgi:hypothetical protein
VQLLTPPFLSAVFLLGRDPNHLIPELQQFPDDRYLVLHMHFNPNALFFNRYLAIDQINIRHGQAIGASENTATPGRYEVVGIDRTGRQSFVCQNRNTGVNPASNRNVNGLATPNRLGLQVIRLLRTWGANGDLFDQANPDPSTFQRQETGAGTGTLVTDNNGHPILMFNGARFANGRGNVAFAPDGSLYEPHNSHGGDIVNTPNFYRP